MGKSKRSKVKESKPKKEVIAPTRGQRKRLDKKERLEAKRIFLEAAKKKEDVLLTGTALSNMGDMKKALEMAARVKVKKKINPRDKKRKVSQENKDMKHFKAVVNCEPFQADPLAAIKKHLETSYQLLEMKQNIKN